LKIGQYFTKIWTITKWDVFLRHSVVTLVTEDPTTPEVYIVTLYLLVKYKNN